MHVKMILPALTEAKSPYFRPIKYSLFPPLGLATLAGYLSPEDDIDLQDEHVERLDLNDRPDLVAIEAYITSARRAYEIADHYRRRGAHVCLGGLHVTTRPEEASAHADTIFIGPGEDTWPKFLKDFQNRRPGPRYQSAVRTLYGTPPIRRDLIRRGKYLVPNSIIVSRGCPHRCDFCYQDSFFRGGRSFYTQPVDAALAEIERLPGRHLYFLDDNLFADPVFSRNLLHGLKGLGRLWQAAGTIGALLDPGLLDLAAQSGLRSLFVGFETLSPSGLREHGKTQNLNLNYERAVKEAHARGIMINASFIFGLDSDDREVFQRTVDWALSVGIETATFHILTPYPGTALFNRLRAEGRILTRDWDLYDTRHCVFRPARLAPAQLEEGYWEAYETFYRWSNIVRAAATKPGPGPMVRHIFYTGGWKKIEPLWGLIIHSGLLGAMRPVLEGVLSGFGGCRRSAPSPETSNRQAQGSAADYLPGWPALSLLSSRTNRGRETSWQAQAKALRAEEEYG